MIFQKNVSSSNMVWNVAKRVVTVVEEKSVITWTEVVWMDVTLGFMVLNVTLVNLITLYFLLAFWEHDNKK